MTDFPRWDPGARHPGARHPGATYLVARRPGAKRSGAKRPGARRPGGRCPAGAAAVRTAGAVHTDPAGRAPLADRDDPAGAAVRPTQSMRGYLVETAVGSPRSSSLCSDALPVLPVMKQSRGRRSPASGHEEPSAEAGGPVAGHAKADCRPAQKDWLLASMNENRKAGTVSLAIAGWMGYGRTVRRPISAIGPMDLPLQQSGLQA